MTSDPLRLLVVSGFVLLLLEWLSTLLMLRWTFRWGIPVARRTTTLAGPVAASGHDFNTANAVVQAIGSNAWIFRRVTRFFETSTPFPIRGTLQLQGDQLSAVGRQPAGGFVFLGAWAVLMGPLVGPIGMSLLYGLSWLTERRRFDEEYDEICRRLGVGSNDRAT